VVLITVIAAVVTPTTDAFNMTLVALPMLLLYVIGILLARLA
jgi:sec-independent protein translocase protein TatC